MLLEECCWSRRQTGLCLGREVGRSIAIVVFADDQCYYYFLIGCCSLIFGFVDFSFGFVDFVFVVDGFDFFLFVVFTDYYDCCRFVGC